MQVTAHTNRDAEDEQLARGVIGEITTDGFALQLEVVRHRAIGARQRQDGDQAAYNEMHGAPKVELALLNGVNETTREHCAGPLSDSPIPRRIVANVDGDLPDFAISLDERGDVAPWLNHTQSAWLRARASVSHPERLGEGDFAKPAARPGAPAVRVGTWRGRQEGRMRQPASAVLLASMSLLLACKSETQRADERVAREANPVLAELRPLAREVVSLAGHPARAPRLVEICTSENQALHKLRGVRFELFHPDIARIAGYLLDEQRFCDHVNITGNRSCLRWCLGAWIVLIDDVAKLRTAAADVGVDIVPLFP